MIWIELRVSQGHDFEADEEVALADRVEAAIDVPARRVFCDTARNLMYCYVHLRSARVPMGRLVFFRSELRRAFRDDPGRAVDEINIVTEEEVADRIPEAVR